MKKTQKSEARYLNLGENNTNMYKEPCMSESL